MQVHIVVGITLLFYAAGFFLQPDSGVVGFMSRQSGIHSYLLGLGIVAHAWLAFAYRSRFLYIASSAILIYALYGIMLSITLGTFNIAGFAGQIGFWTLINIHGHRHGR